MQVALKRGAQIAEAKKKKLGVESPKLEYVSTTSSASNLIFWLGPLRGRVNDT